MEEGEPIQRRADGTILVRLHAQPGASTTGPAGRHGDRIRLRVRARPVEGAANRALVAWLADGLGLPRSAVTLVRGETSRQKDFLIAGAEPDALRRLLDAASG